MKRKRLEIRDSKDRGQCMWKYIHLLRAINTNKQDPCLYNNQGEIMNQTESETALRNFWSGIYQQRPNNIEEFWNATERAKYIEENYGNPKPNDTTLIKEKIHFRGIQRQEGRKIIQMERNPELAIAHPQSITEHMDMVGIFKNNVKAMNDIQITPDLLEKCLKKLKAKKSAGPDNLKPEFYKALLGNEICFNTLLNCFNNLRDGETVPDEWKKSKTVMLPKVSKPQPKDLRPIALTNVSYKIFMAAMKNKIELHLANNDLLNEMQAGFTDGRRIENNLYILKYCIESCFERNLPLFLSSVDYHKAFDSINRGKMIQAMKYYKAHFKDIDKVAEIYQGDKTFINFGEIKDLEIEISSGIRQGCTGSTTLFKLITYKIMEKMEKQRGFVDDMFKINMLYFADDGLQLSLTRNDAARNIKLLIEASREWGLEVNEAKCNIIIYNLKLQPTEIQNIKVVKEIKYLGITLSNGRDCFKKHKELMIDFGKKNGKSYLPCYFQKLQ